MRPTLLVCVLLALGVFSRICKSKALEEERSKKDCFNCDAYFPPPPYLWESDSTRNLKFCEKTKSVGTDKGTFYRVETKQEETDTYFYPNDNSEKVIKSEPADLAKRGSIIEELHNLRSARSSSVEVAAPDH